MDTQMFFGSIQAHQNNTVISSPMVVYACFPSINLDNFIVERYDIMDKVIENGFVIREESFIFADENGHSSHKTHAELFSTLESYGACKILGCDFYNDKPSERVINEKSVSPEVWQALESQKTEYYNKSKLYFIDLLRDMFTKINEDNGDIMNGILPSSQTLNLYLKNNPKLVTFFNAKSTGSGLIDVFNEEGKQKNETRKRGRPKISQ